MAIVSGNYYNFSSNLFSSGQTSQQSTVSSPLGDYMSIKNGSYKKLLKAYYKKNPTNDKVENDKTETNKTDKKGLQTTKDNADDLLKAAGALTTTGDKSLFEQVTKKVTDEKTGEVTEVKEFKLDQISSAVSDFVKAYNSTIKAAAENDTTSVLRKAALMVSNTKANKHLLSKVGITVGSDNQLTVDEKKLKSADINDLKTLFNGSGSYADRVGGKASEISLAATKAINVDKLYGANGKYSNMNTLGSLFNQYR